MICPSPVLSVLRRWPRILVPPRHEMHDGTKTQSPKARRPTKDDRPPPQVLCRSPNRASCIVPNKRPSSIMFMPGQPAEDPQAVADRKAGMARVEEWTLMLIPANIREGVIVTVQEVQCGDPTCAPIDTAITIVFSSGGSGMLGIPMEVKDVKPEHVKTVFPPNEILTKWHAGEDADWPPLDEDYELDEDNMPRLRFVLGQRVECRIGPDAVTGWCGGTVTQLWYREANWPPGSFAPYQIQLDDGRMIFAPQDVDQVIRSGPQAPAAQQAATLPDN